MPKRYRIIAIRYNTSDMVQSKERRRPDGSGTRNYLVLRDTSEEDECVCTDERREDDDSWLWRTTLFIADYLNALGEQGWQVVSQFDGEGRQHLVLMAEGV